MTVNTTGMIPQITLSGHSLWEAEVGCETHVEFLVVDLCELGQDGGRLLVVLADGAGQSLGPRRTHRLLVVDHILNQERTQFRDQIQTQSLPESETMHNISTTTFSQSVYTNAELSIILAGEIFFSFYIDMHACIHFRYVNYNC